jgi:hypothetical protein
MRNELGMINDRYHGVFLALKKLGFVLFLHGSIDTSCPQESDEYGTRRVVIDTWGKGRKSIDCHVCFVIQ